MYTPFVKDVILGFYVWFLFVDLRFWICYTTLSVLKRVFTVLFFMCAGVSFGSTNTIAHPLKSEPVRVRRQWVFCYYA